jgi:hypothetical protein
VDAHAVVGQPVQQAGRRVAVGVVRADRHDGDPCAGRGEERRIGVRAAVVRHLEDVGGEVDAVPDDAALGIRAEVAGEQHP